MIRKYLQHLTAAAVVMMGGVVLTAEVDAAPADDTTTTTAVLTSIDRPADALPQPPILHVCIGVDTRSGFPSSGWGTWADTLQRCYVGDDLPATTVASTAPDAPAPPAARRLPPVKPETITSINGPATVTLVLDPTIRIRPAFGPF